MKPWTPLEQLRDGFCFIVGGVIVLLRVAWWALTWLATLVLLALLQISPVLLLFHIKLMSEHLLFLIDISLILFALTAIKVAFWIKQRNLNASGTSRK